MYDTKWNHEQLKQMIYSKFPSYTKFAEAMGISRTSLYFLLNGTHSWSLQRIDQACKLLGVKSRTEVDRLFFR